MGAICLLLVLKNQKIMSYVRTIRGIRSPDSPVFVSLHNNLIVSLIKKQEVD